MALTREDKQKAIHEAEERLKTARAQVETFEWVCSKKAVAYTADGSYQGATITDAMVRAVIEAMMSAMLKTELEASERAYDEACAIELTEKQATGE
jgi:hypothetical protein